MEIRLLLSEKETIYYQLVVLRCQRGEKGAFKELVKGWEKRLFYYIRRLVDNEQDAWDILQQTWVKVFSAIGSLRQPQSLPTWLYRIARNTTINYSKRAGYQFRTQLVDNETLLSVTTDTGSNEFRFDDAEQVHHGLSKLSPAHREALTLHFLEDMSVEQIAEVLGIRPGTVKSRLYYAKRSLRAVLERRTDA